MWLLAITLSTHSIAASRQSMTLTTGWLFIRGDPLGGAGPVSDAKSWTAVTLPHSFNAADGEQRDYYRGPAWYRRVLELKALGPDRRLFLQFDGAATSAELFVNGRPVGRHDGGHAAFRFDITDALVAGPNLIAVRVDNSPSRTISPLGGDFSIFGGLYRPVSLIEADSVHFDLMDQGGPGLYVRVSDIRASEATVTTTARVANDGGSPRRVTVRVSVVDADGHEAARGAAVVTVPPRKVQIASLRLRLQSPRLWDGVRDPYLYTVRARIGDDGDQVSVPLGVRSFTFDPARGFILNGKPYPVRGANLMHSAHPGKGTAVTGDEVAEDFAILREMGSTAVRMVHFQHPQAAYDNADRLGLVAWTEIGINSEVEDTPEFRANAAQQLRELIAQNYNHPSVVMWGLGNEVYSTDPKVTRILAELNAVAHQADPARPTVYAHCCQADDDPKAMVTDLIGFNRYFGWYPDQKGSIGEWAERFHRAHPERAFAVSEYGAGASILQQEDPPRQPVPASGWHPEQYQALYHEKNWLELKDKPYLWGTFAWVAFDLPSPGRNEGDRPGINDKGLVTYDRKVRKDAWYWYQANWSERPMLYITSRRFILRHEPQVEVKAYTNASSATLFVNGVSQGSRTPVDHILRWPVRLRQGANRIEVRSENGLLDSVDWTYEPASSVLRLEPAG